MTFHRANGVEHDSAVVLEPNSLLIFDGALYTERLHHISNDKAWPIDERVANRDVLPPGTTTLERSTARRVSLTIRVVQRVCT